MERVVTSMLLQSSTEEEQAFRDDARRWLHSHSPPQLASPDSACGFALHIEWERLLHRHRWATVSWPKKYGGRGVSLSEWLIFEEEYVQAGAPERVTATGVSNVAPFVFLFGNASQKEALLPKISSAKHVWCRALPGFDIGGEAANPTIHASREDGGWRIRSGQTWTRRGSFCTHILLIARTDSNSSGLDGLTCFLMPLHELDGVDVRSASHPDGHEAFALVSFSDTYVPDASIPGGVVLGTVGAGAAMLLETVGSSFGFSLPAPSRYKQSVGRLFDLYRENYPEGDSGIRDRSVLRDRLVRVLMKADAYSLYATSLATTITDRLNDDTAGPAKDRLVDARWLEGLDMETNDVASQLIGEHARLDFDWFQSWPQAPPSLLSSSLSLSERGEADSNSWQAVLQRISNRPTSG